MWSFQRRVAARNGRKKDGDDVMTMVKQRAAAGIERSPEVEVEGNIRELVRRDSTAFRQTDVDSEIATNNLSTLLRRVAGNSANEIDNLISELRILRERLVADGNRVERDVIEYAALSQSVIQTTKIITESLMQVKKLPEAPSLSG